MTTFDQVESYARQKFSEDSVRDRIEDRGFAFYVDTQPRDYIDSKDETKMTIGNGPIVIVKETGSVYSFSSNPIHMFGNTETKIGVTAAKSAEDFDKALTNLKNAGDYTALNPQKLNAE